MHKNMQRTVAALGLALLAVPALAQPKQAPSAGQMLQGLLTGNQGQDQALREAYERGYRAGRQDEARNQRTGSRNQDYRPRDNDDSPNDPGYQRGSSSYNR
jgi:hypothetical protein